MAVTPLKVLTELTASRGLAVTGSGGIKVQQGGLTVSSGVSTFSGQVTASSGLTVSGSSLFVTGSGATVYINGQDILGGGGSFTSETYFDLRRAVVYQAYSGNQTPGLFSIALSGSQDEQSTFIGADGQTYKTFKALANLTASSLSDLNTALGYASFDVAIKLSGSNTWTNDLVSIQISASNSGSAGSSYFYPIYKISAPFIAYDEGGNVISGYLGDIRLIVVNEKQY